MKLLIRCCHHHVPPNPVTLLDTSLLQEPTHLPHLALILHLGRTVQYGLQHWRTFWISCLVVEGVAVWLASWVVIFFHTVCTFGGALDCFSQTSTIWDTGSVFSSAY